ncbi:hypothetical protein BHE74_00014643 [Ensete ventricosum]|nr:hypothetical protein BHE74_00014643 [Ensete ventricosum]
MPGLPLIYRPSSSSITRCPPSTTAMACFSCEIMALALVLSLVSSSAELQKLEHSIKNDGSLSLLVIGDWGRKGEFNQTHVATQVGCRMGRIGEELGIDFVVSTGDNFYDSGLTGVDDKAFEESFTNVYTAKSLQKQWYSGVSLSRSLSLSLSLSLVLGNHDYRGDVLAQLSPVLRELDNRWLCLRSFILNTGAEMSLKDEQAYVEL